MSDGLSDTTRPLHVRVAEALGWTRCQEERDGDWIGALPSADMLSSRRESGIVPRFDTDWAATGPLIERYVVMLNNHKRRGFGWTAGTTVPDTSPEADDGGAFFGEPSETPLIAVCNLIQALKEAGKL